MNTDAITTAHSFADDHVIVGGCYGVTVLQRDELASYNRGYACVAAASLVIALLKLAMWMAVR